MSASDNLGQQFDNVIDLGASRTVKKLTGRAVPVKMEQESPEMEKHVNEALELANPVKKKKGIYEKALSLLGLEEY